MLTGKEFSETGLVKLTPDELAAYARWQEDSAAIREEIDGLLAEARRKEREKRSEFGK